jgi:gamma-glutamylputrescine oxidase
MASHSNLWFEQSPQSLQLTTGLPREVDVIIVGGGLAGLCTLYSLVTTTKLNVLLLEEGQIGCRSSGRDIGSIDALPFPTISTLDTPEAIKYIKVLSENNDTFFKLLSKDIFKCDFHKTGGIYLASSKAEADCLKKSYDIIESHLNHFLWPRFMSDEEVSQYMNSTQFKTGMFIPGEGICNPYKLTIDLANYCESFGKHIITNASVESVTQTGDGINIHVHNRGVISTKNIVYCTNVHTGKLIPGLNKKLHFYKQHVVVTNPINQTLLSLMPRCAINSGGVKMRLYNDRMLLQSLPLLVSEKYFDTDINLRSCDNLKKLFRTMYPLLENISISHMWAYMTCGVQDERPLVGEMQNRPKEFLNTAFGCNNPNNLLLASFLIKEMIIGAEVPLELKTMFNPGRI